MVHDLDRVSTHEGRGKLDPPSPAPPAPGGLPQPQRDSVVQAVTAAVERYFAQRGAAPGGPLASAPPSRLAAPGVVAGAVDRYLEQRASRPSAPACGCGLKPPATAAAAFPAPAAPAPVAPPAPPVVIVDFVCESDVRAAMAQGKKIFIGPRTIVTPSARELAAAGEILVRAQR
jgi:hypothetical protein